MWKSFEVLEKIRITKMYSLFEADFESTYTFPGESHDFWECVYVMKGSICAGGDDKVYNMEKGQIIFHKPLEIHKLNVENNEDAHLLIFSFEAYGNMKFFENKVFKLNDEQIKIMDSFIDMLHKNASPILAPLTLETRAQFHYMYLEKFLKSKSYSQCVVSYIHLLFLSLSADSTVSHTSKSGKIEVFSKAVNYMNSNLSYFPTIDEISEKCNTNPTTLKRIFAKYSGLSVHKYLLTLKINTACQMLKEDYSVSEISDALGFSSQGYFSTVFKRETNLYPTEYKNKA